MKSERSQSTPKGWSVTNHRGFSLVEVILSSAVFVLLVTALVGAYLYGQEASSLAGNRARAVMLAEEGLEAVRNIRDPAYINLSDGTHGLTTTSNQWDLSGSSDTTDIFTRQIIISSVDAKRKSVTANVTWQQNPQRTGLVSLTTRLTNWIASSGVGPNRAGWATPTTTATLGFLGTENGIKVATVGDYAYVVRNDGTPDFLVIDVTGTPFIAGSLSLTGTPTNIYVVGNVAYVSNSDNSQELQLIDIATPSAPSVLGTFNAAGNADANGVFVSGNMAYLVRGSSTDDELVVVNVLTPALPTFAGSLNLAATGYEVWVSGTNAYVASGSNTQELQVVNVSNPLLMSIIGSLNMTGNTDAITITGFVTTTLIAQGSQFAIVDITNPALPTLTTSFNTGQTVRDISVFGDNTLAFLAGDSGSTEFMVIDIITQSTPATWGSLNLSNSLNGIAYDGTRDRAYGVGIDDAVEFMVFAPQ